ncbi:MAG TPA: hypothetical protein VLA19_09430 [Herpetosiphonaceae bacterium]|nr:hypothetical protein [Herpetosiphonaceae bacterium]
MAHKFQIGQLVRVKAQFPDRIGAGVYNVVRLMPPDNDGVPCYRIKDTTGHERAVREIEIEKV